MRTVQAGTVRLSEVQSNAGRFEASAYNPEARAAVATIEAGAHPVVPLLGDSGLCQRASNASRFARVFVRPEYGVPFLGSADIIGLDIEPRKWISRRMHERDLDNLAIQSGDVLLSRSGTLGNCALAGAACTGMALTEHALRISADDLNAAGYAAAFLRSRIGRLQVGASGYGSVVTHIEPHHLERIRVPLLPERTEIGAAMRRATKLRDEATALIHGAVRELEARLGVGTAVRNVEADMDESEASEEDDAEEGSVAGAGFRSPTAIIRAKDLEGRFEALFHGPAARNARATLTRWGGSVKTLGEVGRVQAVTKFRERLYLEHSDHPLLNSKQLFQVDPVGVKYLALANSLGRLIDFDEIELTPGTITVTSSGTIGRVQLIPDYMKGWSSNQHSLRVHCLELEHAAFLFVYLRTSLGAALVRQPTYGSVILTIDREQLEAIPVPWLSVEDRRSISQPVTRAHALRSEAWNIERKAIALINALS